METMVLEQYIMDAERAFEQKEYLDGMDYLHNALAIEPNFGKAHNHLGWLYLFQFEDIEKAEKHLQLALKHAPTYGPVYMHMSHLLFETQRFEELSKLLADAAHVGSVKKSFVFAEMGRMHEVSGKFRQAIKYYKDAIRWAFDDRELINLKDGIRRCRQKRWTLMF